MPRRPHTHTDVRPPIGESDTDVKLTATESSKIRAATGRNLRMDASYYLGLPEYKDMTLFWKHDNDGSIDVALDLGAQLVPKRKSRVPQYKGVNDRGTSEYECKPGVYMDQGYPVTAYLMAMPKEEYHKYYIQPNRDRNAELQEALTRGQVDAKAKAVGSALETYAANINVNKSHNTIR